jgi:hypothetical protein
MKYLSWSAIVNYFTGRTFAVDQDGRTHYFPYGPGRNGERKGFILRDATDRPRIAEFHTYMHLVYLLTELALFSTLGLSAPFIGVFILGSLIYLLTWRLYTSAVTQTLTVSPTSYKQVILNKISFDAEESRAPEHKTRSAGKKKLPLNRKPSKKNREP